MIDGDANSGGRWLAAGPDTGRLRASGPIRTRDHAAPDQSRSPALAESGRRRTGGSRSAGRRGIPVRQRCQHACTGSVLHSAAGDLVLTAAHCLTAGAPGTVRSRVRRRGRTRQRLDGRRAVPGSALGRQQGSAGRLRDRAGQPPGRGIGRGAGRLGAVTGHRAGSGQPGDRDRLSGGRGRLADRLPASTGLTDGGFPSNCRAQGLVDGTSGAPWISGSTVTGVIGGLHGGGCAREPVLLGAVRRAHHRVAGARRGRRARRRAAEFLRRSAAS